jgi:predicted RNA methylase
VIGVRCQNKSAAAAAGCGAVAAGCRQVACKWQYCCNLDSPLTEAFTTSYIAALAIFVTEHSNIKLYIKFVSNLVDTAQSAAAIHPAMNEAINCRYDRKPDES